MTTVIPWPAPGAGVYDTAEEAELVSAVCAMVGTPHRHPACGALRFGRAHVLARLRTLTYDAAGRRELAAAYSGDPTARQQLAEDAHHYAYEHP